MEIWWDKLWVSVKMPWAVKSKKNPIYHGFKIKQFISSWTRKVHSRGISGLSWSRGQWGASTRLRFSDIVLAPTSSVCWLRTQAGCLRGWQRTAGRSLGCMAPPAPRGGQDSFLSPSYPAECPASLCLDAQPHVQGTGMEHGKGCYPLWKQRDRCSGSSWGGSHST